MQRLRQLMALVIGLVATLALAGCDVTGTMKVRVDDLVELDLRAVIDADQSCEWRLGPGVRTDERRMRNSGQRLCLLQGTVNKEVLRQWAINIAHTGEHIEFVANPLGVVDHTDVRAAPLDVDDLAIEVQFPGDVIESTGISEGNTVRFTDVSQLGKAQGLRVVALDHAGPPLGIVVPVVAFGLGGLAVAVLWAARNRQALGDRFSRLSTSTLGRFGRVQTSTADQQQPAAPPAPLDDQPAPGPGSVPGPIPGPGSLLPDDLRQDAGATGGPAGATGASGWERPGARPVEQTRADQDATQVPDHEKWAPRDGTD